MCASTGWANLIGRAGTGKTTVLRTVVDALHDEHGHHEAAADQVVVVSTSAMVARRSGDAIGADRSYSIEGLVEAVRHGVLEPTDRTWVIVEEAAMVDTPRMATLLATAGPAVIRTVGDDRQLAPIGPGGWYPEQLARHPGTELTHVYRQRDPDDVRDFTDLGAGKVEEAVRSLDDRSRIIVVEELGQRAHAIVDLYLQERQRGRGARDVGVVLDGSNHVLDDVNRRIQRERLVMEEIGGTPLQVEATDTDRRWLLYRGDHVVFRERVVTRDEDVIRNGEHGEITAIDHFLREATVALDGGREVRVELAPEAPTQPVVPAYAHHVAAFQGNELPVAIVSPSRTATRNSAYTAVTRAKEDVHIVIDRETYGERPVDGLIRDWSRGAEKRTAWSQLDEAGRDRWAASRAGVERAVAIEPEPVPDRGRHAAAPERYAGGDARPKPAPRRIGMRRPTHRTAGTQRTPTTSASVRGAVPRNARRCSGTSGRFGQRSASCATSRSSGLPGRMSGRRRNRSSTMSTCRRSAALVTSTTSSPARASGPRHGGRNSDPPQSVRPASLNRVWRSPKVSMIRRRSRPVNPYRRLRWRRSRANCARAGATSRPGRARPGTLEGRIPWTSDHA